ADHHHIALHLLHGPFIPDGRRRASRRSAPAAGRMVRLGWWATAAPHEWAAIVHADPGFAGQHARKPGGKADSRGRRGIGIWRLPVCQSYFLGLSTQLTTRPVTGARGGLVGMSSYLPSLYKARNFPTKQVACCICVERTRGRTQKLILGYGVEIWLCKDHASREFQTQRDGRDFELTLMRLWQAHGCWTLARHKALKAFTAARQEANR